MLLWRRRSGWAWEDGHPRRRRARRPSLVHGVRSSLAFSSSHSAWDSRSGSRRPAHRRSPRVSDRRWRDQGLPRSCRVPYGPPTTPASRRTRTDAGVAVLMRSPCDCSPFSSSGGIGAPLRVRGVRVVTRALSAIPILDQPLVRSPGRPDRRADSRRALTACGQTSR